MTPDAKLRQYFIQIKTQGGFQLKKCKFRESEGRVEVTERRVIRLMQLLEDIRGKRGQ